MYGVSRVDLSEEVALVTYAGISADLCVISDIFDGFAENGINIDMISQSAPNGSQVDVSFTCQGADLIQVLSLTKEFAASHPGMKARVISDNCKLQLFGKEMREMHGVFAKVLSTLRDIPLELRLVTTSEVDISLLLDSAHIADAMDALQSAFDL